VTERVLTARDLNRALLARQLLLERARLSLPKVMERVGGLQTQYAPSGYVGLWSRVQNFERDALTRALERRTVVQATLMRVTIRPIRFLPHWDANLLVHARRTAILPERFRPRIFTAKNPFSVGTFLVDGAVAGVWRVENGRIVVEPYERLSRSVRKEVDEEAERLGAFHN
jgi:hypothetical protein